MTCLETFIPPACKDGTQFTLERQDVALYESH